MTTISEHIGEGLELLIEGIPAAVATPANQAQAALMLARHSIPLGADLTAGVLGGIRYASLRIGTEVYKLKYSLIVLRPMVALDVYSEAIEWIEFKQARGTVDNELANETIAFLRRSFKKELGQA
jgi:hypothetical protein